jgi:hypothetical protein
MKRSKQRLKINSAEASLTITILFLSPGAGL